ncbi:hypothetical protein [Paenibacillus sp. FSL K6-2524]|uniref:hypothetical protein n=1 Tax=Paenibacillus sp. FSL K6-2524 TaxID=2954516 RepID=UPI0030F80163
MNSTITIIEFKDGKILTDVINNQSYYISHDVYMIIEPTIKEAVSLEELYNKDYENEDINELIEDLLNKNILKISQTIEDI